MNAGEQDIIKMLQQKISEHEEKIKSFRHAIGALSGSKPVAAATAPPQPKRRRRRRRNKSKQAATAPVKAAVKPAAKPAKKSTAKKTIAKPAAKPAKKKTSSKKRTNQKPGGETMEAWVLRHFQDSAPKSNRMLREIYNKETGRNLDMNGFAARLAMIKKKKTVKSAKHSDGVAYNGKAEWFDGANFKPEYLAKIKG